MYATTVHDGRGSNAWARSSEVHWIDLIYTLLKRDLPKEHAVAYIIFPGPMLDAVPMYGISVIARRIILIHSSAFESNESSYPPLIVA
jgi:hypothetical protein